MRILITIPKEFEQHFQTDRFEDSLHRLSADAHLLAGNYEQETAVMLIDSFKSSVTVPPHGRLIDADAQDAQIEALIERYLHGYTKSTWDFVCELRDILKRNRTIIEAEEGEDA